MIETILSERKMEAKMFNEINNNFGLSDPREDLKKLSDFLEMRGFIIEDYIEEFDSVYIILNDRIVNLKIKFGYIEHEEIKRNENDSETKKTIEDFNIDILKFE